MKKFKSLISLISIALLMSFFRIVWCGVDEVCVNHGIHLFTTYSIEGVTVFSTLIVVFIYELVRFIKGLLDEEQIWHRIAAFRFIFSSIIIAIIAGIVLICER